MLREAGFAVFLHALGGLMAMCLARRTGVLCWISGLLWGMLLWVVWGLFLLSFKLPFSAVTMFGGLGFIAGICLVFSVTRKTWDRRSLSAAVLSTLAIAAASAAALRYNAAILSYDSFNQIFLGKALAYYAGFHPKVHPAMASWGAFVLVLQAAAVFLHTDFIYVLWPVMGLVFLASFFWLALTALRTVGIRSWPALSLCAAATLFLASSFFFLFQCFYIHNNLPSAIYLLVGISCLWLALQSGNSEWQKLSIMALGAFILLRTEAPLFAVIFLSPLLWMDGISRRARLACALPLTLLTVAWYLRLNSIIGRGTDILSPTKACFLISVMIVFCLLISMTDRPRWRRLAQCLPWLIPSTITAVALAAWAWKPQLMRDCALAMMDNCFTGGRWGITWPIMLAACGLAVALPRFPRQDFWTVGPGAFLLLLWLLGIFRDRPYRPGWGDSANRLMTQVLPILVMYLVLRFGHGLAVSSTATAPIQLRKRLIAALAGLWLVVFIAEARMPVSRINRATVLEEPPMNEDFGFSVAIHPRKRNSYAAALHPGPATVVFDLGRQRSADRLEMTEYAPTEALTDYAWDISSDREHWKPVFDTRSSPPRLKMAIDELSSRYDMTALGEFRYLRLSFRAAAGQNRLLIRKVRLYSMPMNDWLRAIGWKPGS